MAAQMRARGKLGKDQSTAAIRRVSAGLADLAEKAAAEAAAVLRNGRRAVPKALSGRVRGRLTRALAELAVTIERTTTLVAQARTRLAGQTPAGAARLVSLHDADARPIRKGRIGKPVEFGYKAQVADNDDGVIPGYSVEYGAVPDAPQLAPAVQRAAPGKAARPRGAARRQRSHRSRRLRTPASRPRPAAAVPIQPARRAGPGPFPPEPPGCAR